MPSGTGNVIETAMGPDALQGTKARELALLAAAGFSPYVRLIGCGTTKDPLREAVVLCVAVEVGQRPAYDIKSSEDIAVLFDLEDRCAPEVLALRRDFPPVPHTHLRDTEYPRSLCLYEEQYDEVKLRWTPTHFLTRLAEWLRDTAEGVLHRDDQPLEPLLTGDDLTTFVVDPNVFGDAKSSLFAWASMSALQDDPRWPTKRLSAEEAPARATHLLTVIWTQPRTHGVIRRSPQTLQELHGFFEETGDDLIGTWRRLLRNAADELAAVREQINRLRVILLLVLPKQRTEGHAAEGFDVRAFECTECSLFDVGERLGVWVRHTDGSVGIIVGGDDQRDGSEVSLTSANCHLVCGRRALKRLSGTDEDAQTKLVCVGAGALGSQVLVNLARMGFGTWSLLDHDVLLPHNVARHALLPEHIGKWKASCTADVMNTILVDSPPVQGVPANLLRLGPHEEALSCPAQEADLVVDMSTSVAVSRRLAREWAPQTRKVSLFLNPAGTDLVLLAEDAGRSVRLDCLEMQYYRHITAHPEQYAQHLRGTDGSVRYGNTCRDVSSRIPQDAIATLSGIASRAVRQVAADPQARIVIWQSHVQWLGVTVDEVRVQPVTSANSGAWSIIVDAHVCEAAQELRTSKLPNETGGVLLGSFDAQRKLLYVVDALPAPPDSREAPGAFERGTEGLPEQRKEIAEMSATWLDYIGEWHSHPPGCSTNRSSADCRQCEWIARTMHVEGLPGLMMIIGDEGPTFHLHEHE